MVFRILVFFMAVAGSASGADDLTILFTNDMHSYFTPYRDAGKKGMTEEVGGYARLSSAIRQERERRGGRLILVDAGDFSEGTLFHTVFPQEAFELRLMGAMGYDAVTFGNHDFDFSPSGLARMMQAARQKADAPLPVLVMANFQFTKSDPRDAELRKAFTEYPVREWCILERNGLRIGLFGIIGKDAAEGSPFARPVRFTDPVEAARRVVKRLREREKVDLVVCLSHSGTSPKHSHSEDELLAEKVPGIDVIISGHTHTVLSQPLKAGGGTVIVSAGSYSSFLGVLGLRVDKGKGATVTSYELQKITSSIPEDRAVATQVNLFKKIVEERYLSHFGYRYDQAIATTPFDFVTIARAYVCPGETGLGNLVTDAYRYAVRKAEGHRYRHVHAAVDVLGCIRASLFRGDITVQDVFRILSLGPEKNGYCGNTLVAGYLTGRELKNMLEIEASIAPRKKDAYLSVSGIRFRYNPNRMIFDRVTAVELEDADGVCRPMQNDRLYRVVVNSYLASLVGLISEKSHGILEVSFRDEQGRRVTDLNTLVVSNGAEDLREWVALAEYLASFPSSDGNSLPSVPGKYEGPEGRIIRAASWNPVDLLAGGKWITWSTFGLLVALLLLLVMAGRSVVRRIRKA